MSKQQELIDLYSGVLTSTGVDITEEGNVVTEFNNEVVPVTIDKLPMVLPTKARLKAGIGDDVIAFHPMSENALRGESVVLKKLRVLMMGRVSSVLMAAAERLIVIAADPTLHGKLSPKASEFLSHVHKADERTVKALDKVLGKVSILGDHRLVNFNFKRPGEQRKDSFTRVCNVSFPVLDELLQKEPTLFGVKMRNSDKETILGLFSWLLNTADEDVAGEQYSAGTRSMVAPYFTTLLESYIRLGEALNGKIKLFKKGAPDLVEQATINLSWGEAAKDLSKFRDIIPALRGNEGAVPSHAGSKGAEMAPEAPVAKATKLNLNVDSGGNLQQEGTPAPAMAPTPPTLAAAPQHPGLGVPSMAPQPAPQPMTALPLTQGGGLHGIGERVPGQKVKMSDLMGSPQTAPPSMYSPAPVIGAPNARDMAMQQGYRQYTQHPQAYYDPNVYNQVQQQYINPQQLVQQPGWGVPQQPQGYPPQQQFDPWVAGQQQQPQTQYPPQYAQPQPQWGAPQQASPFPRRY